MSTPTNPLIVGVYVMHSSATVAVPEVGSESMVMVTSSPSGSTALTQIVSAKFFSVVIVASDAIGAKNSTGQPVGTFAEIICNPTIEFYSEV